jgi:hypothetical protein
MIKVEELKKFKELLSGITIVELISSNEIREELGNIQILINDISSMRRTAQRMSIYDSTTRLSSPVSEPSNKKKLHTTHQKKEEKKHEL